MLSVKVKISGITRPEDAEMVVKAGTTHVGCVMVPEWPQRVSTSQAKEIFAAVPRRTIKVLVFRGEGAETVMEAAQAVGTTHVQLYGYQEPDALALEGKGFTVYRTHEVPTGTNLLPPMLPEPTAARPAVLDVTGGASGITFPWEILGHEAPGGIFVSGGVRPENVCALLTHQPYGIDLTEGVERTAGVKDKDRVDLLFEAMMKGGI